MRGFENQLKWGGLVAPFFMIIYQLTEEERQLAYAEGYRRQKYNEDRKIKGRNGGLESGPIATIHHLIGAAGEMAVASYLGLKDHVYQEKTPVRDSFDLPHSIDVKTRSRHWYDLPVHPDDFIDKNYWLVTIENKEIRIHGWINASECKKPQYKRDYSGGRLAYFIPQSKLNSPESFRNFAME